MATNFPSSLDSLTNPTSTSNLNDVGVEHHLQHANANDAIEALQAKVGANNSSVTTSLDYKATDLKGRLEGWNDLFQQVIVRPSSPNAPSLNPIRDGIYGFEFPSNIMTECFTNFHINHDFIPGSMSYPHVHWTTTTTATGTVRWGVEYTWAQRFDTPSGQLAFPATTTLYMETTLTDGIPYKHIITEAAEGYGITGTSNGNGILTTDSVIMARFFRDAAHVNDTYPDNVFLLIVDLHYQSVRQVTPSRFPPFI